jgi:hypothetical protein
MRQSILALWPNDSFENHESINSIAYMMNRHQFAVMAYRYYWATGIMQQIINNTFLSGDYLIAQEEPDVQYTLERSYKNLLSLKFLKEILSIENCLS